VTHDWQPDGEGERPIPDGYEFALLLTHDVDRPYKTYQSLYYALTDSGRRRHHLWSALPGNNPYWQFGRVCRIEDKLGVRSAFYFLDEQPLRERPVRDWVSPRGWQLFGGRYDVDDPAIRAVVEELDGHDWEVGLHGSYESYDDRDRLRREKRAVERVLGDSIRGGRQHYLNLSIPETWRHHRAIGLDYDTSPGSSSEYGFQHGYGLHRPFDDHFVVFPLTMMELALPDPGEDYDDAWAACEQTLREAREHDAVMTVLWHPMYFTDREFPGYARLYRDLVATALDMGAWVGSPGDFYAEANLGDRREPPEAAADGR
jgi:hypothetical protein